MCPGNVCQYKLVTGGGGTVAKQTGGKGATALSPEHTVAYSGSFQKKDKNNMDPSLTVTGVQAICEISWGRQN